MSPRFPGGLPDLPAIESSLRTVRDNMLDRRGGKDGGEEAAPVKPDHGFKIDASSTQAFTRVVEFAHQNPERVERVDPTTLKAVVIGGGTGAPVSIRTLLGLGCQTSAVVAMADDGGSTGILREEAHATPPGDVRKCLVAFAADAKDPLTVAFKYRFDFARNHTLGNLMLSALEEATGSFPEAIKICGQLLGARGRVYPSTLNNVTLCAQTRDGRTMRGQAVASHSSTALERVWLESPERCLPYMEAIRAIREADVIVLGPGSLFTSIIPNLLVPGIVDAIRQSRACTVFVCSLADRQGETWGMTAREHVEALLAHGMEGRLDYVLVHRASAPASDAPNASAGDPGAGGSVQDAVPNGQQDEEVDCRIRAVKASEADIEAIQATGVSVLMRDMVDPERPTWHDPVALADAFMGVFERCRSRQR